MWCIALEVQYREDSPARPLGLDGLRRVEPTAAALLVTRPSNQFGPLRPGDPAGPFQLPAFLYLMGHAERRAVDDPGIARGQ